MKLVWTSTAIADRADIYDYIETDDPTVAVALDELFSKKADQLTDHPRLGWAGRVNGTRELVVHKHYSLIYDLAGDLVRILRVLHTARQWPPPRK